MDDFDRIWTELVGRLTGPLTFRVILQPAMAIWFATRDGMMDARTGRPPYFWSIFHDAAERRHLLTEGWKHIRRVAVLGTVMDLIYQMLVFKGSVRSNSSSWCSCWRSCRTCCSVGRSIVWSRAGGTAGRSRLEMETMQTPRDVVTCGRARSDFGS